MGSFRQDEIKKIQDKDLKPELGSEGYLFFVENCIVKIANLLALGYGEAGTAVIAEHLKKSQYSFNEEDDKGEKVMAIFGFIMINQFNSLTEVLDVNVMSFVNMIAEAIYSSVVKYGGAPNKNVGEAFLLVWKLAPSGEHRKHKELAFLMEPKEKFIKKINEKNRKIVSNIADLAIFSMIRVFWKVNCYKSLREVEQQRNV